MAVFAQEQGDRIAGAAIFFQLGRLHIHAAGEVPDLALAVVHQIEHPRLGQVGHRFIVNQAGVIPLPHPGGVQLVIAADARFVAQAPHDDGGMILVPFHHPGHPVEIGGGPLGIVIEQVVILRPDHTVAFQVGFLNEINPVPIAQSGENGGVGVVGGADAVDVVLLHQADVLLHMLIGAVLAEIGMRIVPVDPF